MSDATPTADDYRRAADLLHALMHGPLPALEDVPADRRADVRRLVAEAFAAIRAHFHATLRADDCGHLRTPATHEPPEKPG